MQPTSLDPNAPEFAPIRGELARLFIQHKVDLCLADWADAQVIERVDDIANALMRCDIIALQQGNAVWLERFRWFAEACERLFDDQPATRLNG